MVNLFDDIPAMPTIEPAAPGVATVKTEDAGAHQSGEEGRPAPKQPHAKRPRGRPRKSKDTRQPQASAEMRSFTARLPIETYVALHQHVAELSLESIRAGGPAITIAEVTRDIIENHVAQIKNKM